MKPCLSHRPDTHLSLKQLKAKTIFSGTSFAHQKLLIKNFRMLMRMTSTNKLNNVIIR